MRPRLKADGKPSGGRLMMKWRFNDGQGEQFRFKEDTEFNISSAE
jgi:hypothetical protein